MKRIIHFPLLCIAVLGFIIYLVILILIFLIHSIAFLFVLPMRMSEGEFRWDYSKVGIPRQKSFWEWVGCIYSYELRGNAIWELIYDSFIRPKWNQRN